MAKPIKKFKRNDSDPSKPFNPEDFRKVLLEIIENPSEENLERINYIRLWFLHSIRVTEGISRHMRGLTRKLRIPDAEDLQTIQAMVTACRQLSKSSELLIRDYEVLREKGIIELEIDDFKKSCRRLREGIYYIESVYLSLPGGFWAEDEIRRN